MSAARRCEWYEPESLGRKVEVGTSPAAKPRVMNRLTGRVTPVETPQ
jgi:hypothetical protein